MAVYLLRILILLITFVSITANAENNVEIEISKSESSEWIINYQTDQAAQSLVFIRNPDGSRIIRWTPLDNRFQISIVDGVESISRKDGSKFSTVSFKLTPTYRRLNKDYAPFSPYTDGGTLFYTGRFYACPDSCENVTSDWKFSLNAPDDEHIVFDGKVIKSSLSWTDNDQGRMIYVGSQYPIQAHGMITLIDRGLPKKIRNSLDYDLPKLLSYFENKLGSIDTEIKPSLFASYAKVHGESSHTQGGTLPKQIFMHWNTETLESNVEKNNFREQILWSFSHEAAHFYQADRIHQTFPDRNQSWVHEGSAESFASIAMIDLIPEINSYVESKFNAAKKQCIDGLKSMSLIDAATSNQFQLYYDCGMIIHNAIHLRVKSKSNSKHDLFSVWKNYRNMIRQGETTSQKTFLNSVEFFTSAAFSNEIYQFVNNQLDDPEGFINNFIDNDYSEN